MSDAAQAARRVYGAGRVGDALRACAIGRLATSRGRGDEVDFAATEDAFDVVPRLAAGRVVAD
jgi:phosphosulfolactate phosphohydrolase-like enzyme